MRTARPLVPRSLLTALVSAGVATDTSNLTDGELDELSRHHRVLAVYVNANGVAGKLVAGESEPRRLYVAFGGAAHRFN